MSTVSKKGETNTTHLYPKIWGLSIEKLALVAERGFKLPLLFKGKTYILAKAGDSRGTNAAKPLRLAAWSGTEILPPSSSFAARAGSSSRRPGKLDSHFGRA